MSTQEIEISYLKELMANLIKSQEETNKKFQDTDKKFQDTDKKFQDTDKKFQDTDKKFQDTNEKIKQSNQKTNEKIQETNQGIKELTKDIKAAENLFTSQWGKLIESLVKGDLLKLLQEKGIEVQDTSQRRKGCRQGQNFEFDIIAHNGDEIVIVEVKTTLRNDDVKDFVEKLSKVKSVFLPEYKHQKVYGAMAYLQADAGSERQAENQKLFVIRATGSSASIVNSDNFQPKAF